jgi:ATP-dependent protease ClpP protease subunit
MSNEITIGEIGSEGTTAMDVRSFLANCDPMKPITVRIHSEGGEVFEGFAMYDAFKNYTGQKRCVIESAAFSIASYVAMAFDQVEIASNGYLMIHNPWSVTEGDDAEHAKNAMLLAKLKESMVGAYTEKTGKSADDILSVMKNETFFNAQEALAFGLVNSIANKPVRATAFARKRNMPQRVFASLFEADVDGNKEPLQRRNTMSDSQPVAATIQEIKRAFPKAKADFIVKCMEQQMPMPQVAATAVEETMAENDSLMARISALETEMAAMKAKSAVEVEVEPEMPVEEPVAKAKSGVAPVAKAKSSSGFSAKAKWKDSVHAYVAKGFARDKAILSVEKDHPGLREQMLEEVNS